MLHASADLAAGLNSRAGIECLIEPDVVPVAEFARDDVAAGYVVGPIDRNRGRGGIQAMESCDSRQSDTAGLRFLPSASHFDDEFCVLPPDARVQLHGERLDDVADHHAIQIGAV